MTVQGSTPGGVSGITSDPQQAAPGMDPAGTVQQQGEAPKATAAEEAQVRKRWKAYTDARKFDENFRKQVAVDRRYAAGTSDLTWAVTTNLIGAYIDILVALLYARDPDVSVKKAPQVENEGTQNMEGFAKTLQIVISHLWKKGKLKKAARKGVRSVLSNAEGWFKCTMVSDKTPQPEVETALNDAKETLARLKAQEKVLTDSDHADPESKAADLDEKKLLIADLEAKLELAVNKMFVVDFVPTENIQVSTDVANISDYLDADWIANEMFVLEEDAAERFPLLSADDLKAAKKYYQKPPKETSAREIDNVLPQGMLTAESAQAFTESTSAQESPPFLRVVELWDRRDKQIRTMIDGVKRWAKLPYPPPYPTQRFYPYFYFAFYEVDGNRHAQSLSWRLYKLQDEYSTARSNFRLTRERSIPGVLFNATHLDEAEAKKLTNAKHQEYTALNPGNPEIPLTNLFAPKPVAAIDMRVFDTSQILADMERISGVQEALSSAVSGPGNPKTATEANIQQSGTNARTGSDRDALEEMLNDMATYTAQQALQCLSRRDAQRLAGAKAFWPEGLDIEDLFTLVEVNITAGTTGKPRQGADQQAWTTVLPLIRQYLGEIEQAVATGNTAMAKALTELIKETMLRLGDETDVDRFIPQTPPPGSPGAGAPPPPVMPKVTIALKGMLDPATSAAMAQPVVERDQPPPPAPPPGAAPGPGSPPLPGPVAPVPGGGTPVR